MHRTKLLSVPLSIGRESPTRILTLFVSDLTRQGAGDLVRHANLCANILLYSLS